MNVGVIDIGSPGKDKIGWAIVNAMGREHCTGTDLDEGVCALAGALEAGPLALGFEAPMFVPGGGGRRARAGQRWMSRSRSRLPVRLARPGGNAGSSRGGVSSGKPRDRLEPFAL